MAKGDCNFPGCARKIVEEIDGKPIVAFTVAHIRGVQVGSARYDEAMHGTEGSAFGNLILWCTSHRKFADELHSENFPVDLLERWKHQDEADSGEEILEILTGSNLQKMLSTAFTNAGPRREIRVELAAAFMLPGNSFKVPFEHLAETVQTHIQIGGKRPVVCVTITNADSCDVWLDDVSIHCGLGPLTAPDSAPSISYRGENAFGPLNPQTPCRIAPGDSVVWMMKLHSLLEFRDAVLADVGLVSGFFAAARLRSGELEESTVVDWEHAGLYVM